MAADKRTAFLRAYDEILMFIPFFSSFFRTTSEDIIDAESVEIEIRRGTRKIAPVISNIAQLGGKITKTLYTRKEFIPPIVALTMDFAPGDLIEKAFGETQYQTAGRSYLSQLVIKIADKMSETERQIARNPEFQAAQIFQTGTMTLYDDNGEAAYTIDFLPKATHFPTVGTNWSDNASDPDADINALRKVIKKDSGVAIKNIIFGETALKNYIDHPDIQTKFDLRRVESGVFDPDEINPDADFLGDILIGNKRMAAWVYEGQYEDPSKASSDILEFVGTDKVILLPDPNGTNVDFRKTWCRVPTISGVDPRFADLIPSQMELADRQVTNRVWVNDEADTLNVQVKTRPLCIPVSIDAFGCLDTVI
jgi:hypothetical protein